MLSSIVGKVMCGTICSGKWKRQDGRGRQFRQEEPCGGGHRESISLEGMEGAWSSQVLWRWEVMIDRWTWGPLAKGLSCHGGVFRWSTRNQDLLLWFLTSLLTILSIQSAMTMVQAAISFSWTATLLWDTEINKNMIHEAHGWLTQES